MKGGTFYGKPENKPKNYDHTNVENFTTLCDSDIDPINHEKWEEIPVQRRISFLQNNKLFCFERDSLIQWLTQKPINPITRIKLDDDILRQFGIDITNSYYNNDDINNQLNNPLNNDGELLQRQNAFTADEIEEINRAYIIDNFENRNINDQPIIPSPVPQAPRLEPVSAPQGLVDELDDFTL